MQRYLIFFSYIGTGYSGLQIQRNKPLKTIIGVLEDALSKLSNESVLITSSSRTDKNVHALCNTAHLDITPKNPIFFNCNSMILSVNKYLKENYENIRLMKAIRVNKEFHARRSAIMRTYIYRICSLTQSKNTADHMIQLGENNHHLLDDTNPFFCPIFELERCCFLYRSLDAQRLKEAAEILSGCHDYRNFTNGTWLQQRPFINTTRFVNISIERGVGYLGQREETIEMFKKYSNQFECWDFVFKSKAFLYRQVRKLTNSMILYSLGAISMDEMKLQISGQPCADHPKYVSKVPGYGLYLIDVVYNDKDLIFTDET